MTKTNILFIVTLLFFSTADAQLPELTPAIKSSKNTTGIEKARALYYESDFLNAEAMLYIELEKGNFQPHDFLLFANTLMLDNKPSLATEFLKEYEKASGKTNVLQQMQQLSSSSNVKLKPIETKYPVSNPTSYRGKIYTSINGRMMEYDRDCDGNLSSRREVLMGITDMPMGSVAYYNNGDNAVVSLIDELKNTTNLYLLYKKKGKWKKAVKLFSSVTGNYAFPYIDEENNKLYFSSDRPGGQGGYDLYVSVFNGKIFESPISLGTEVNTPGNEINPLMTEDWFYFSSNGHVSKGGFDIYKFKKLGDQQTILLNASDINTSENEVALLPTSETSYYIKRENKEVKKLYSVSKQAIVTTVTGNVIDEKGAPIAAAYVLIGGSNGGFTSTDSKGNYIYKSPEDFANVSGRIMADGYESKTFNTAENQNASVQLTKVKPIEIIKEVERKGKGAQIPNDSSTIVSDTQTSEAAKIKIELNSVVIDGDIDESVSASSRPDRGLYYIVIGSTYNYAQAYDFWNKWLTDFSGAEILEYGNGLYRIAYYAGGSEEAASRTYTEAKKIKKDVWILRPKN